MTTLNHQTDEALDRMLAELLGWTLYSEVRGEYTLQFCFAKGAKEPWKCQQRWESQMHRYKTLPWSEFSWGSFSGKLPRYTQSLDECGRVEESIITTGPTSRRYYANLCKACSGWDIHRATARQRTEALIATLSPKPTTP